MDDAPLHGEAAPDAPHLSPADFRALGHRTIDYIADYLDALRRDPDAGTAPRFPVMNQGRFGDTLAKLPTRAPTVGLGQQRHPAHAWDQVFHDLDAIILPGLTHWQSPHFYAYFPANASEPAVLGELLAAGLGVQGMLWLTSPACTELEIRVLDWLRELVGLPECFASPHSGSHPDSLGGSVIQGTASEATLVALCAARHRVRAATRLTRPAASAPHFTLYTSAQAHSSVIKAAMIAGLADSPEDATHLRLIDVDANFAMRTDLLEAAITADLAQGFTPMLVVATVGTTGSTAIDDVEAIAEVLRRTGLRSATHPRSTWLHVDAAHAGAAAVCPEFRPLWKGCDHADSVCFNPHKWLLTNFDCDCLYTADRAHLVGALSILPEYLRTSANSDAQARHPIDLRDWQVPLGRRFRALKLWLVLRHYGQQGLQTYIRGHIAAAKAFAQLVHTEPAFELCAPVPLNLICFRAAPPALLGNHAALDSFNRQLLTNINATGRLFLTHTVLPTQDLERAQRSAQGAGPTRFVLRLCVGSTYTTESHTRQAFQIIRDQHTQLASSI